MIVTTLRGSAIERYKGLVGKRMGTRIYVHRQYAKLVVPPDALLSLTRAARAAKFGFNCVMYDWAEKSIRADEAPDFDSAREPHVGRTLRVAPGGEPGWGRSDSIWHHKWLWVADDYAGFDVEESREWSRLWTSLLPEPAKGTDRAWQSQLAGIGLK